MSTSINSYDQNKLCTRSNPFKKEILNVRKKENLHVQEAPLSWKELAIKVSILAGLAWIVISAAYNSNAYLNEENPDCIEGRELGVKAVEKVLNNCIGELASLNFTGCIIKGNNTSLTDCFKVCQLYYQENVTGK
jgi:hypothetical protein